MQGQFTGDATYWRGLVEGLCQLAGPDEFLIYLDERLPHPEPPTSDRVILRYLSAPSWRIWSVWTFPLALRSDRVEVAHVQYSIPPILPCPVVTSVHDISFKRHPEFFKPKDRFILDAGVKSAAKRAARVLAISEYTKREIVELYEIDPAKVTVVYPGVDAQFRPLDRENAHSAIREKYRVTEPFMLTLGVIQPRKNLQRLLEGLAILKVRGELTHKLVVVGKYGWLEANLNERIASLGLTDDVLLTGYAPYEDLPLFYNAADLFVYPSVYEGFGLPPLEAMACGTPVITGNRTSLPEVVDDAGIMVDPYDPSAFADAICSVLGNPTVYDLLSRMGLERSTRFSWAEMARQVDGIYHESGRALREQGTGNRG